MSRVPRLAAAAWSLAAVLVAAVAVGVVRHLQSSGSMGAMNMHGGMNMSSASDALTRAGGDPLGPLLGTNLFTRWQLDAVALAALVLAGAVYLTGVALVPLRSGERWPVRRTAAFFAGLAVCGYATCGAVGVYDQVLFTAHMVGHLALVMVAPAFLVLGAPLSLALAAAPPRRRARIERIARGRVLGLLTAPPVALASYTVVIVGTHLTGLMDIIMRSTWAGQLEHLVFVVIGIQFFVLVVGDEPVRWRLATPARWLLLAVAMAVDTFTGVVLLQGTRTVSMVADPHVSVNQLSDTHTGGAIMWFGGDAIMAAVMIVLVIGWLRRVDTDRADRKGWLEQARVANFAEHTEAGADVETFDDDDATRASYNAWLARLNDR